jgi:hypothetical protein
MSFYVGQRVVCVDVNFSHEPLWRSCVCVFPRLNSIYTIRAMRCVNDLIGLCLSEIVNSYEYFIEGYAEAAFDSRRFRPVRTTSIDQFTKLVRPVISKSNRTPELV